MTWDRLPWRHLGLPVVVVLAVCLTQLIVGLAAYWQYASLIHAMRANVDRQEITRERQFTVQRQAIVATMQEQAAASDARMTQRIDDRLGDAGRYMSAVSARREKALRLLLSRSGASQAEIDSIFPEPVPSYGGP